ncbi:MAG: acetate kinase [Spirochaetota bacterium]
MKILVINSGSSSLKYQLFQMDSSQVLASGLVERIGEEAAKITHKIAKGSFSQEKPIPNHKYALTLAMEHLLHNEKGVIQDKNDIAAIGHRVAHGGEKFYQPAIIHGSIISAIEEHKPLAPLHNPANLMGILACQEYFENTTQVAVFDTAFHQTIPDYAFHYAIDYELYSKYGIRRYGFHGTSHRYVATNAAKYLQKRLEDLSMITLHLGNGCSMAAIRGGTCIDTSMGMTPLEGIVMGTRSGDIDAGILFHLHRELGYSVDQIDALLNKNSGLKGIAATNDMRDLLQKKQQGDTRAALAFAVYTYRIKKYIGAYAAALGKLDAIVFTGGVGENSADIRTACCSNLEILGIALDENNNASGSKGERSIQKSEMQVAVLVIPTNEELQIAKETVELL